MHTTRNYVYFLFLNIMKKKKTIIISTLSILVALGLFKRNRELSGIIQNQQLTIDGLIKEVKNLSYHLGKKTLTKNM